MRPQEAQTRPLGSHVGQMLAIVSLCVCVCVCFLIIMCGFLAVLRCVLGSAFVYIIAGCESKPCNAKSSKP